MKSILCIYSVFLVAMTLLHAEANSGCKCEHAKDYQVVKKAEVKEIAPHRTHGHWYITTSAKTHVEFAHTAMQAVMNLYDEYKLDLTYVSIVPTENLVGSLSNGWAAFAADSLGGLGLSGADQEAKWDWRVFVAHQQITQQQIDIAELWVARAKDYPTKDMISSCMVDTESLRKHIVRELNISFEEAVMPTIHCSWYRY